MSVNQLCQDNNCSVIFYQFGFCIQDKATNQVLLRGRSNKGIYPIPSAVSPVNSSSLAEGSFSPATAYVGQQIKSSMWHNRLGHPTNEVVQTMLKTSQLPVLVDAHQHICPYCLSGKMHTLPFPSTHVKSLVPFQRIRSDLWGPSPCKSYDGYR